MTSKHLLEVEDWRYFGTWPGMSLQDSQVWLGPEAVLRFHEVFGFWKGNANVFTGGGPASHCHSYGRTEAFATINAHLENTLAVNPGALLPVLESFHDRAREYQARVRKRIRSDVRKLSNHDLAALFLDVRREQHEVAIFDQFGIFSEGFFEERVTQILHGRFPDKPDLLPVFAELVAPWTHATIRLEERAMLGLWDRILSRGGVDVTARNAREIRLGLATLAYGEIEGLVDEFGWHRVFLRNPSFTPDHYLRELTHLALEHGAGLAEYVRTQISAIEALPGQRRRAAEALYDRLGFTPAERALVDTYRITIDARNEASTQVGLGSLLVNRIADEFCARLAVPEEVFHALYIEEVADVLRGARDLSSLGVEERVGITGFWFAEEREFRMMSLDDARRFLGARQAAAGVPSAPAERTGEAKGLCASPGRAEGPARIVLTTDDFGKFRSGDILIAETTTVDYGTIMRKAAGIITVHGGITSHAAVVARELGIPAIVGYPAATKAFHDGEVIAFDTAEGGTVRRAASNLVEG